MLEGALGCLEGGGMLGRHWDAQEAALWGRMIGGILYTWSTEGIEGKEAPCLCGMEKCPWICGIRSKQVPASCVWQGLGPKKIDPLGKTQKQTLGCPQGDGDLLGCGDGAAELRGLAWPRGNWR